jgi:hypothetical protein
MARTDPAAPDPRWASPAAAWLSLAGTRAWPSPRAYMVLPLQGITPSADA